MMIYSPYRFIIVFFLLPFSVFLSLFVETSYAHPSGLSNSNVIINEVQANEPGSYTKLEWVELYNNDSISHDLGGWAYACKEDTTPIPPGVLIPANGFLILSRQLLSPPPDSISFEGWWGDRSGVWGDSPEENYPALQTEMSLTNTGGAIALIDPDKNVQAFTWDRDCGDGISLERVSPDQDIWLCCACSDKSTPGRKNSVNATHSDNLDLSMEPNPFSPDGDGFEDEVTFRYTLPAMSDFTLKIFDIEGRLIKTIFDGQSQVSGETTWDGRDNDSRYVRIGIYVVWVEVKGNTRSVKKMTLVVAKK